MQEQLNNVIEEKDQVAQKASSEKNLLIINNNELYHRLDILENSFSWKITKPLRCVKRKSHELLNCMIGLLRTFRQFVTKKLNMLSMKSPGLATIIRFLFQPVARCMDKTLLNKVVSNRNPQPLSKNISNMMHMDYQLPVPLEPFHPLVSVIVPNYNHERFLRKRLESIYSQTYQNYEVILLDDCSTDKSQDILNEFYRENITKSTLVLNDKNSGGVFNQWERGLEIAKGDLVWIAESDDWCTHNFLETLVPFFQNEAIRLAYSKSLFMDKEGNTQIWSIDEYLYDLDQSKWSQAFVNTAHNLVRSSFGIKNIIPNVSSALFKSPKHLKIVKDPLWKKMKTCGDWILYLHLIRGGMVGYSTDAINYYRIHDKNTSVKSYVENGFYEEHEEVAKTIRKLYSVEDSVFIKQQSNLQLHWKQNRNDFSDFGFRKCYNLTEILGQNSYKKPNLLMAGFAFCSGGGETFPIQLANLLYDFGYSVTYLDCMQEPRLKEVRASLNPNIPVISNASDLQRISLEFGIDIIHSHHAWVDNTILDVLPENTLLKTVVTLHGMYETIDESQLKKILPRLGERTSHLIYTADKNLDLIDKYDLNLKCPVTRISNALPLFKYEKINLIEYGIPEKSYVITLVSRAIPEKGWVEAIEAIKIAREITREDIHLILIGDGPIYNQLKDKELPNHVHLLGFQINIRGFFAASHLGLLPSKFKGESYPLVLIDCINSGKPMIASSLGEIPEMLNTKNGMAGEVFDLLDWEIPIDNLAKIISTTITNQNYYNKMMSNVLDAQKRFDPEIMYTNYDTIFMELIEPPSNNRISCTEIGATA